LSISRHGGLWLGSLLICGLLVLHNLADLGQGLATISAKGGTVFEWLVTAWAVHFYILISQAILPQLVQYSEWSGLGKPQLRQKRL
jgi:hypothetical protein